MINTEIFPDIEQMLDKKDWDSLKSSWAELKSEDIAELLKNLHQKYVVVAFRLIPMSLPNWTPCSRNLSLRILWTNGLKNCWKSFLLTTGLLFLRI